MGKGSGRRSADTAIILASARRRGTVSSFVWALRQRETWLRPWEPYFVFGFLWGLPVPLVTLGLHLWAAGLPPTLACVRICFVTQPLHWVFALHPFLFGVVFGAIGTVVRDRETRVTRLVDRLSSLADTDGLTGLNNHRAFQALIREEATLADRSGRPVSLVLFDLDHFKAFNDRHGHPAGDQILRAVAGRIRAVLRPEDLLCRYGGEEFAAVLPGADLATARAIAERVRARVAGDPFVIGGIGDARATLSGGLAQRNPEEAVPAWIERTDRQLYRAKDEGRNRIADGG